MTTVTSINKPVIVGAGLAGLMTALSLAPAECIVLSAAAVGTGTSTDWAQGGIAAAVGPDDHPEEHLADTLAAGAGLCDEAVARAITADGPAAIAHLVDLGVRFDRNPDGSLKLGLEGAHGRNRIVHAMGDQTGHEVLRALIAAARSSNHIELWSETVATRLITVKGRVTGVLVRRGQGDITMDEALNTPEPSPRYEALITSAVILATGGVGGLFEFTTNPLTSRGSGLALAARAGAVIRDIEMVQFHPTGLDVGLDPMPLVSEAVRGEGAILVNELGDRVIDNPLAPRDIVSRAEWAAMQAGHRVFLDCRTDPDGRFPQRFPSIFATCATAGLDPIVDLLPVRPTAHYHMGGVAVDLDGRSTIGGLFAVGEVASTGLHGANRLASNSLLEAAVCGPWVAQAVRTYLAEPIAEIPDDELQLAVANAVASVTETPAQAERTNRFVREQTSTHLGVLREAHGLRTILDELRPLLDNDAALVATLMALAALQREESRGAHFRTDFPHTKAGPAVHSLLTMTDLLAQTTTERTQS